MTQSTRKAVMKASQQWIAAFNQRDVQACIERYQPTARMQVYPFGNFVGREKIAAFWQKFAENKPGNLVYHNVDIKVLNDSQAILSANWRMNIAQGFISKELWTQGDDGQWYLEEDDFSVLGQQSVPLDTAQRTALVLVDLQDDYFSEGRFPLENVTAAVGQARRLLAHFREKRWPVIHIQHIFEDSSASFFAPNTPGIKIEKRVAPIEGEPVIVKHQIDSFVDTALEQTLIEQGIEKLVIVGAMAQACIQSICRSASNKGYQCEVIEDAIAAPVLQYQEHRFSGAQMVAASLLSLSFGNLATRKTAHDWINDNSKNT